MWTIFKVPIEFITNYFCFIFWFFGHETCRILALQPGSKPCIPALGGQVLTIGPPEKFLEILIIEMTLIFGSCEDLDQDTWPDNFHPLHTTFLLPIWKPAMFCQRNNLISILPEWSFLEKSEKGTKKPSSLAGKLLCKGIICFLKWCCLVTKACLILETPWTVAHKAPLSMGFSRQEYWGGLPFPSPASKVTQVPQNWRTPPPRIWGPWMLWSEQARKRMEDP